MSKTARSDWSASCPWGGITGKPTDFGGVTDIGQLKGAGFSVGQVARWNGTKFVPYTIPTPSTPVTPTNPLPPQVQFVWDVPSIAPLQTAYQDFPLLGAVPGEPISHGVSMDTAFCQTFAKVVLNDSIRLMVVNFDLVAVDLPSSLWQIQRFP